MKMLAPNARMRFAWIAEAALLLFALWFVVLVGYLLIHPSEQFVQGMSNGLLLFLVILSASAGVLLLVAIWAELRYRSLVYELKDSELVVTKGVLSRSSAKIPYGKIREIHVLRSGIHSMEQVFGVATLKLEVEGEKEGVSLPGIGDPEGAVRTIMARAQGRPPSEQGAAQAHAPAPAAHAPVPPAGPGVMNEILKELKEIKMLLEKNSGKSEEKREPPSEFMPAKEDVHHEEEQRIEALTKLLSEKKKR